MAGLTETIIKVKNDQSGQTVVEFLVVCPVILLTIFLIMRTAMMINAKFLVNYAAYCAVRTGIVYSKDADTSRGDKMLDAALTALAPLYGKIDNPVGLAWSKTKAHWRLIPPFERTKIYFNFGEKWVREERIDPTKKITKPSGPFDSQTDANALASNTLTVTVEHRYDFLPFFSDKGSVNLFSTHTMRMQSN